VELGIYVNLFETTPQIGTRKFTVAPSTALPNLEVLREKVKNAVFYRYDDNVVAFGPRADGLEELGFGSQDIDLSNNPKVVTALLREGFLSDAARKGYEVKRGFTNLVLDRQHPIETLLGGLVIFQGFDIRSMFIRNPYTTNLVYGFIADLRFKFELDGIPASYSAINQHAWEERPDIASQVIRDVRVKTGDLLPSGGFNTESSRWRLGRIQQFMAEFSTITLPDGTMSPISTEPMRVVIGGR
jgi:hypothetical protein